MSAVIDRNGNAFRIEEPNAVKIVFLDLDGTLLNSDSAVSDENLQSILKAKEKGIKVLFATGRSTWSVTKLLEDVLQKHNISLYPGVYLNGCVAYDENGSVLLQKLLSPDVVKDVLSFVKEHNLLKYVVWYDINKNYCVEHNEYVDHVVKLKDTEPELIKEEDIEKLGVYKILFCIENTMFKEIFELCKKKFANKANVSNSLHSYIEIFDMSTNKAKGIEKICEYYNIDMNSALVCGDGENDIEMLNGVKYSVAVANAAPTAKKVANYIGPKNVDNAVAHILKAFCCI